MDGGPSLLATTRTRGIIGKIGGEPKRLRFNSGTKIF